MLKLSQGIAVSAAKTIFQMRFERMVPIIARTGGCQCLEVKIVAHDRVGVTLDLRHERSYALVGRQC